jgi:serine/threonine protein kinase/beta-lactam-binding protein with PASTA domain
VNAPPAALLDARYRVGSLLARGGMSTVYRGTDTRLDRPVAIKVMDPRLATDPAFRGRLEREARSAARIDHPAVVDVYDQGQAPGGAGTGLGGDGPLLFLVMELVEGGTLRDVLRMRGALGVPAAFAVMERVLSGLAAAHRLGLVHRDVKPENVLISRTGEVKVADFGLVTASSQAPSTAGMIMGTVAYLSPEQVATGNADARSDVYAAGIMLYELLTGAPPYSGDTAISVAYRHVNSDVPPPSQIAGEVPPELDELVLRCTRRDPAVRPVDAAAMLAELHRVAVRLEVPRVPPPVPPPRPVDEQDTVPAAPERLAAGTAVSAALPAPGPRGTRALPRPHDGDPRPHVRARKRSRKAFAVWTAIVLVLALLVGVTAWWLGNGRWTEMPRLVGLEAAAAQQLLTESDLVARVTEAYDDDVAEGLVSATDPAATAQLPRGSTVQVTVSTGRPTVPRIAPGTSVADAEQALRDAGLTPVHGSDDTDDSDSVPEGAVLRTDPKAGTELRVGEPVKIVVSGGESDTVKVPDVVGKDFDDAADILDESDLDAEGRSAIPFLGRSDGQVVEQSPRAGTTVERGSTVTLTTV